MKNIIFLLLLFPLFGAFNSQAQNPSYAFRIYLSDKNGTSFNLANPQNYLSQKSITRREKFFIPIDSSDLPVNQNYIDSILNFTNGSLMLQSRWHNSIVIRLADTSLIQDLNQFSFFKQAKHVASYANSLMSPDLDKFTSEPGEQDFYGDAWKQIKLCSGNYLHEKGHLGEGMLIAVLDAGFSGLNTIAAFDSLRSNDRILDSWNFVKNSSNLSGSGHGSSVLSCMAANLPEEFVGTAPHAQYVLYVTDDVATENTIEEDFWTAAAERADSLGVDLISSSLGYNYFDQSQNNYSYADMDGQSTFIAQSANAAVQKGIMTVISAGNEGNGSWHYLLTPADANQVLTIGSVDQFKTPAGSSSWGPNSANVRKPELVGLGQGAAIIESNGNLGFGFGTSFATPIIAGLTACFMQAHPNTNPERIKEILIATADHFANPNDKIGYGIPNFQLADELAVGIHPIDANPEISIFPNPAQHEVWIQFSKEMPQPSLSLYDLSGKVMKLSMKEYLNQSVIKINTETLVPGIYFLILKSGTSSITKKILIL